MSRSPMSGQFGVMKWRTVSSFACCIVISSALYVMAIGEERATNLPEEKVAQSIHS